MGEAEGAYHLFFVVSEAQDLLTLGGQVELGHGNLPAVGVPGDVGAHGPTHDLVTKADTQNPHTTALNGLPRILDEVLDPLFIVVGSMLGAGEQQGVDRVEVGIRLGVVDDVVGGDGELRAQGVGAAGGRSEEGSEDACVTTEPLVGFGLRGVGLEDGETEGLRRGAHDG